MLYLTWRVDQALINLIAETIKKGLISNKYREKIDEIKQSLLDEYLTAKAFLITDYNIFMAIAGDIGYNATGKATNNNELNIIAVELSCFIQRLIITICFISSDNFLHKGMSNNVGLS
ncbi:hypothetical protein [Geminocystis sp. GBBB08]|uniref:hypothetical protein n=1 Tax=Geminocystis sp. GBBB08 TaxID=2604140 RepID=UPI0027E37751|nr:hypothetical protein [Geminocystis sp. GBBB08]MBL1208629.1 hypothetical protein [Geminocystis sp. GBBB08]